MTHLNHVAVMAAKSIGSEPSVTATEEPWSRSCGRPRTATGFYSRLSNQPPAKHSTRNCPKGEIVEDAIDWIKENWFPSVNMHTKRQKMEMSRTSADKGKPKPAMALSQGCVPPCAIGYAFTLLDSSTHTPDRWMRDITSRSLDTKLTPPASHAFPRVIVVKASTKRKLIILPS